MSVKAIPAGYHSITPYLILDKAAQAIEFYKKAFGAHELYRMPGHDGKIGHAEIQIGDSRIMMADENHEMDTRDPHSLDGSPVSLLLYVENVDEVFHRAIDAGAQEIRPLKIQFYGDRSGTLEDPFGHQWHVATHIEDVSPEEMQKRMEVAMAAQNS
jgi:PhnB protein